MHHVARPLKWPPIFPFDKNLVLWFPFDDRSGAVLRDRSGKRNDGVITGASWAAGKDGPALSFDHITGRVDITDPGSSDPTAQFDDIAAITIAFWAYLNSLVSYSVVFSKDDWSCYMCHTDSAGVLYWGVNGSSVRIAKAGGFSAGAWYHYVLVSSGTQLLAYRNGALLDSVAKVTAVPDTTGNLKIGCSVDNGNIFDGLIEEFHVYNRALNAVEAKRLYNLTLPLVRY